MTIHNIRLISNCSILILFLMSELSFSQQSVNLSNVSLIVYNEKDTDLRLFEETSKNKFIELSLDFDNNSDDIFITTEIESDEDTITQQEIKLEEEDVLIHINDLKETNLNSLFKSEFKIKEN